MAESDKPSDPAESTEPLSTRARMTSYLTEHIKDASLKSKLKLQHAIGLGHQPNVIPAGEAVINGELRRVEIGWHPVAGFGGKWFAEQTGLGKLITEKTHKFPDPSQHWAVLVGDFAHELWMDEHLTVIYINEKVKREDWHTYEVGKTHFNDEALRQTGEMVIHNMREKRPAYNLISNNCQNFAIDFLDAIKVGTKREFGTTFAIYQRATGKGTIIDLFKEDVTPEGQQQQQPEQDTDEASTATDGTSTVDLAHQVMDEHTTKLDSHYHG